MKKDLYLYIHIPFCRTKCTYCSFYSVATLSRAQEFKDALKRAISAFNFSEFKLKSIYFGGGTPSLVPTVIAEIIEFVINLAEIDVNYEITVEANPESTTLSTLKTLYSAGVNRLSIGVQSSDNLDLTKLGRGHNFSDTITAFSLARSVGFKNISADVLLATENQTPTLALSTVKDIANLEPEHISAYLLKVEPNTLLFRQNPKLPNDDLSAEIYLSVSEYFRSLGYEHYEISSFAKKNHRAIHNTAYWKMYDYLGIGPSAHSCLNGVRYSIPSDINKFCSSENPLTLLQKTSDNTCNLDEKVMLALRMSDGIKLDSTLSNNKKALESAKKFFSLLIRQNFAYSHNDNEVFSLTPQGFLVSNSIAAELLEILDNKNM